MWSTEQRFEREKRQSNTIVWLCMLIAIACVAWLVVDDSDYGPLLERTRAAAVSLIAPPAPDTKADTKADAKADTNLPTDKAEAKPAADSEVERGDVRPQIPTTRSRWKMLALPRRGYGRNDARASRPTTELAVDDHSLAPSAPLPPPPPTRRVVPQPKRRQKPPVRAANTRPKSVKPQRAKPAPRRGAPAPRSFETSTQTEFKEVTAQGIQL